MFFMKKICAFIFVVSYALAAAVVHAGIFIK